MDLPPKAVTFSLPERMVTSVTEQSFRASSVTSFCPFSSPPAFSALPTATVTVTAPPSVVSEMEVRTSRDRSTRPRSLCMDTLAFVSSKIASTAPLGNVTSRLVASLSISGEMAMISASPSTAFLIIVSISFSVSSTLALPSLSTLAPGFTSTVGTSGFSGCLSKSSLASAVFALLILLWLASGSVRTSMASI